MSHIFQHIAMACGRIPDDSVAILASVTDLNPAIALEAVEQSKRMDGALKAAADIILELSARMVAEPGIADQEMKLKVDKVMKTINAAASEKAKVPGSEVGSKSNDEITELIHLKVLDSKAGIQPAKFSGREEEFA